MKHLLIILCIILATELNAQQQKIVDMYTPINVDFYKRIMDQTSATITERTNNVKTMMSWIIDLKSATSESKVNQELDLFYKKLDKCLHWDDISELSITKLSEIELGIKKAIAAYNSRIAEYNSKIAKDNDPQTIINNGIAKFKNNDLDGALTDFKTAEKLAPDFSGSYHLQGVIYYYKMQYAFAISAFTKAIDRDQNNKTSYELRGWSYNYSKKFLLALPDFNKIITMNSNDESGYFGRGYAKDNLGDIRGAIKDYEQTISLNPNNSMAFNNLGWSYFESGDSKKALEYVNKAISLDQQNSIAYDSRGEIKLKINDLSGCISDCTKAIELDPTLSNCYLVRGKANLKLGKSKNACEDWSKSGELGNSEAYVLIRQYCNK